MTLMDVLGSGHVSLKELFWAVGMDGCKCCIVRSAYMAVKAILGVGPLRL